MCFASAIEALTESEHEQLTQALQGGLTGTSQSSNVERLVNNYRHFHQQLRARVVGWRYSAVSQTSAVFSASAFIVTPDPRGSRRIALETMNTCLEHHVPV